MCDEWVTFPEDEIHDFPIPDGCHWKDLRLVTDKIDSSEEIIIDTLPIKKSS